MIGLRTGKASGVWVVDLDRHDEDGRAAWASLTAEHGAITLHTHRTPRNSLHLFFQWRDNRPVGCSTSVIAPGIDVKGEGGYVIIPPSRRRGKNPGAYRCHDDDFGHVAEAPDWLYALTEKPERKPNGHDEPEARVEDPVRLEAYAQAALDGECRTLAGLAEGTRNPELNKAAFRTRSLRQGRAANRVSPREPALCGL